MDRWHRKEHCQGKWIDVGTLSAPHVYRCSDCRAKVSSLDDPNEVEGPDLSAVEDPDLHQPVHLSSSQEFRMYKKLPTDKFWRLVATFLFAFGFFLGLIAGLILGWTVIR